MSDDVEMRRRRALYRAHHRGTKELDHLVGRFADAHLGQMASEDLARFERFLAVPDPLLQAWVFATEDVGDGEFAVLIAKMRQFHGLDSTGKVGPVT